MRIGYACVTVGPEDTQMKTCRQSNADEALLTELIGHNLDALDRQIEYNIRNRIRLFRISSDLIPFGSSPVNRIPWRKLFEKRLQLTGEKIQKHALRVSMHPGQYTVLNSPDRDVVERAVKDLAYHCNVLDTMNLNKQHKIILHVGGVYGDKEKAAGRFLDHCRSLSSEILDRLVLENDDRSYHTGDVLSIARKAGLPAVYDNLHDRVNPDPNAGGTEEVIAAFGSTWRQEDGPQKIHYSQQDPEKKPGSHSASIAIDAFLAFTEHLPDPAIDVMLEVKDKNLSAIKCILCTQQGTRIKDLEEEWKRYKYKVLEKSQTAYDQIRGLFADQSGVPPTAFYRLVEGALRAEDRAGSQINAALHVWGYFKKKATPTEQQMFFRLIEDVETGKKTGDALRRMLWRMTLRYDQPYLKESYYFHL